MRACWRLGGLAEFEPLRLRAWAHALGYRGHILTKSRVYCTTYAALRSERVEHQGATAGVDVASGPDCDTEAHWRYLGSGHTPGAALIATDIAEDLTMNRELARETRKPHANRRAGERAVRALASGDEHRRPRLPSEAKHAGNEHQGSSASI
ncbi:replication initiator [Streptomyces noursei]|uniref:replication initiator n=2 Tax=Streptomyces TaxID=1883 RepID=UPI0027E3D55D|nr:replication initiator [Streptomyces noursei]